MSSVLQYTDCELRQVQFALVHCINAFNLLDSNLFNCVLNNYYQSVNIRVNLNCTKQLHQSVNIGLTLIVNQHSLVYREQDNSMRVHC